MKQIEKAVTGAFLLGLAVVEYPQLANMIRKTPAQRAAFWAKMGVRELR